MKAGDRVARGPACGGRSGQAMIFLILVVIILAFIALWQFDLHKAVYVKHLSQNAGDGAALAAARWQGITLNLIGDLNIMQAVALSQGDTNEAAAIAELQARLCYVGPLVGLVAAQQAAKQNGVFTNPEFTERLSSNAATVLEEYAQPGPDGTPLFPEPYPNCWEEYADMLSVIADDGVAAGPDNARYYNDYRGGHILIDEEFYDAVAGRDWCWFFLNQPDLLEDYTDFQWWPPLPNRIHRANPMNSEFFGLGLRKETRACGVPMARLMESLRHDRGLGAIAINTDAGSVTSVWFCYDASVWTPWLAFAGGTNGPFPAAGQVKPQYNYAGADAAVRIEAETERLTPGSRMTAVRWTAAAKPFGYLELNEGAARPDVCSLVLPAFHDVRLIPMDASSAPVGGAFNLEWRRHIEEHLPEYMQAGLSAVNGGCWYCRQLIAWEDPAFRHSGVEWLAEHSDTCETGGGGGGGGHAGGTRRGH